MLPLFHNAFIVYAKQEVAVPVYSYGTLHFRQVVLQCAGEYFRCGIPACQFAVEPCTIPCFINAVVFFVELIIAYFILYP